MTNHPAMGWVLAALALVAGYVGWGWPGVVLAITVIVFWLLLQFNRAVRTMRRAAAAPIGSVPSAVMLHAKLKPGLSLAEVLPLAGSLGETVDAPAAQGEERYRWRDPGGREVMLLLRSGRVVSWTLDGQAATPSASS